MVTNKTWVGVRVYRRQLGCRTADGLDGYVTSR